MNVYCEVFVFLCLLMLSIHLNAAGAAKDGESGPTEEDVDVYFGQDKNLKPVVQFSCVVQSTPWEDAVEADLNCKDDQKRLTALGKLLEVSAPSSVPLQYKAYMELKDKHPKHASIQLASRAFNKKRIKTVVFQKSISDEYSRPDDKCAWCIRAVGVMQLEECLPRLLELSQAKNLYVYLAAEKSIEEFPGKVGEDALIKVISFWQYDAYIRAGNAMCERNPQRLSLELEKMRPPDDNCSRGQYGLLLAKCKNPKAVPILCETVKGIGIIDRKMFNFIAELGQASDKKRILDLPAHVRKDQERMAKECVKKYLERMKKSQDDHSVQSGGAE